MAEVQELGILVSLPHFLTDGGTRASSARSVVSGRISSGNDYYKVDGCVDAADRASLTIPVTLVPDPNPCHLGRLCVCTMRAVD